MLNQDHMNYGAQPDVPPPFHRPEEGKIESKGKPD